MEGFRFEWKISKNNLVEIISHDQIKTRTEKRAEIEKKFQSDIINLKGINTGKISLSAELIEESLKGIKTKDRNLHIIQPFKIFPEEPLYILHNNNFQFELILSQNHIYNQELNYIDKNYNNKDSINNLDIRFNSKSHLKFVEKYNQRYYNWETKNNNCGRIEGFGFFTSVSRNCSTKVIAIDERIDAFNKEENTVFVVEPTSLELGIYILNLNELNKVSNIEYDGEIKNINEEIILNYDQFLSNTNSYKFNRDWKLIAGNYYLIKNFLMYERHPIYFNNNIIQFTLNLNEFKSYIKIIKCMEENKICLIYAQNANAYEESDINKTQSKVLKLQDKMLNSRVPYTIEGKNVKEYSVAKNIQIFDKLRIINFNQNKFYLPYLGYKMVTNSKSELETILLEQELRLLVTGGTLKYRYSSNDRSIIDIRSGILYGRNIGTTVVTVYDDEIEGNYDSLDIEVKEIYDINYFEERQEILIEKPFLIAPIPSFSTGLIKKIVDIPLIFTNCTNANLEANISFDSRDIKKLDFNEILADNSYGKYFYDSFNLNIFENPRKPLTEDYLKYLFLRKNKKITNLKIKSLELESKLKEKEKIDFIDYLKYANFGVCKLFSFKSEKEGMIKMGFISNIENQEGKSQKILSSIITRIYSYKPLVLIDPTISDSLTTGIYTRTFFHLSNLKLTNFLILAPGSGVFIKLNGGVEKWSDYIIEYQENQYVIDRKNNNTASIDFFKNKFSNKGKDKEFYYECESKSKYNEYENNDYEISITIQNKPDKTLINPAKTSIPIIIGCQEPKYLSLFFLGLGFSDYIFDKKLDDFSSTNKTSIFTDTNLNLVNNKEIEDVNVVPQKKNIRYFEQKATFDGLRIYSFDQNKRLFHNFTSYKGNFEFKKLDNLYKSEISDSNLVKIYSENDLSNLLENFKNFDLKDNIESRPKELKDFLVKTPNLEKLYKLDISSQNKEFIYQSIYFYNLIQKFELTYKLINNISQSAIVEVIDIPFFSPNNCTIYMIENNFIYIDILHGSGDFEFSVNNKELANFEDSPFDKKIKITALKPGVFTISMKDKKIGIEHKSVAIIYISAIKRIELIGGGLLMVNDTSQIEMKVYNEFNHVFSIEQVKKMNLVIDKSSFDKNGIIIKSSEIDYNNNLEESIKKENLISFYEIESAFDTKDNDYNLIKISKFFYIKGITPNLYSISVIQDNTQKGELNNENILRSNYVKLEVFKRLDIYPSSLLLIPGSEYTLNIKGGPSNEKIIVKKFEIIDNKIASVGLTEPRVHAFKIGETILKITISIKEEDIISNEVVTESPINNKREIIIATKNVPIRIDFPESVEIVGTYNRKIYTKSTIRLFAALKKGKETFTYADGPVKFNWFVDNSLIANLKFYQKDTINNCSNSKYSDNFKTCNLDKENSGLIKYHNSIGTFLKTYKQGISEVKLNVDIIYPEPYAQRKPNQFSHAEKILIDDNIFVDIAEFYDKDPNKSGLYLVPYNIDHELVTNKNKDELKYSLVSQHCKSKDPLINLRENGKITTYDRRGLAYVMIEKKEIDNKPFMPLVLPIYVVEFYSLFVERSYQIIDTEIGQSITLKVLLQHEYGLLFAESKINNNKEN